MRRMILGTNLATQSPLDLGKVENVVLPRVITKTLTNDEIINLPTVPQILLPAIEELNYSGIPKYLPLIRDCYGILDSSNGAYDNEDGDYYLFLDHGSDDSSSFIKAERASIGLTFTQAYVRLFRFPLTRQGLTDSAFIQEQSLSLDGSFQDNAIIIGMSNGVLGNLTLGHASNNLKITMLYNYINTATGELI